MADDFRTAACPKCSKPVKKIFFNAHSCPKCGTRLDLNIKTKFLLVVGVVLLMVSCMTISTCLATDMLDNEHKILRILLLNSLAVAVFWLYYIVVMRFAVILVSSED